MLLNAVLRVFFFSDLIDTQHSIANVESDLRIEISECCSAFQHRCRSLSEWPVSAGINIAILILSAARYSDGAYAGPCGLSKNGSAKRNGSINTKPIEFYVFNETTLFEIFFTQAVGLRTGYVAVTCGRQRRNAVQLSAVIGHS